MKGLLFLLVCTQILTAQVSGQNITNGTDTTSTSETHLSFTSEYPTTTAQRVEIPATSPSPDLNMLFYKECLPVFFVAGGLIIACTILLLSTLLLSWKVCHLNRRIKDLSSNNDLISNSEYWLEPAKKNKSNAETEPKETTVLMSDLGPAQETDKGNGTTKEEGGTEKTEKTEKADGQEEKKGEENKKEGDANKSEGASAPPAAADEDSSSSKPQEKATDSDPTKAAATSTPEEPKHVV